MKILALEFSSERRSVALADGATVLGEAHETGGRHTRAFALIEEVLRVAGVEREAIECVAVGLGPGSYTGIRAAIALVQGWQLARGVRLLGVSSVDCLAAQAQAHGWRGRVTFALDALRGEFYTAGYEIVTDGCRAVEPLRLASHDEVQSRAEDSAVLAGHGLADIFPSARELLPDAAMLARLASTRGDFVSGENLEPIYLRETSFVKAPPPRALPA